MELSAISYLFKFKPNPNRGSYVVIKEIFIPSEKIIFNIYGDMIEELNVFISENPRTNCEGMTKIEWDEKFLEDAKKDDRLQKIVEETKEIEQGIFEKEFKNFDKQIKNITLNHNFVKKLVLISQANLLKKQTQQEAKTYLKL